MSPACRLFPPPLVAHRQLSSERGSLLIVAMIFAAVIALSLASYIKLASSASRAADRSFYANATVDLAECGIESAMACFDQVSKGTAATTAWSGWTLAGSDATRTLSGFTPGPNATGEVRVWVNNYGMAGEPKIVAQATITPHAGLPMHKFLEITLGTRGPFSMGMVAKTSIKANGNGSFDSWNSNPDNDPTTAPVGYSSAVATAECAVGVNSSAAGAVTLSGNGGIYGSVHTLPSGTVTHSGNAFVSDTIGSTSGVDMDLVHQDFSASFPAVTLPTPSVTNSIASNPGGGTSFPRTGDTPASDSKYYYTFGSGKRINLSGNNAITVAGDCVFIFDSHNGVSSISTSGNSRILINNGASLVIYTNGDISHSGNGIVNNNVQPEKCLVYGTAPVSQSISISGNGSGGGAYYVPNADVSVSGNGAVRGAIVANKITASGNASFHYDLALGGLGGSGGLRVTKWKELRTAAERQIYATELNF